MGPTIFMCLWILHWNHTPHTYHSSLFPIPPTLSCLMPLSHSTPSPKLPIFRQNRSSCYSMNARPLGLCSFHGVSSALDALSPCQCIKSYTYFKVQHNYHPLCDSSHPHCCCSLPYALPPQTHAYSPDGWIMDGWPCLLLHPISTPPLLHIF